MSGRLAACGYVSCLQIEQEGGEPAIDEAYGRNPASAEQVMFPDAYIDGAATLLGTAIAESEPDMSVAATAATVSLERCLPSM